MLQSYTYHNYSFSSYILFKIVSKNVIKNMNYHVSSFSPIKNHTK